MTLAWLACHSEHADPSATTRDGVAAAPTSSAAPSASPSASRHDASPLPQGFSDTTEADCAREADASVAALGLMSGCASCIAGAKRFMGACKHDPSGTWSVALSLPTLHVARGGPSAYGFRIQVVRRPACSDGGLCFSYSSDPELVMPVEISAERGAGWSTFDFDHDGTPEILVRGGREAWVLTAVKDAAGGGVWQVVPYSPSAKLQITGIEDVDHDGRPDLRYQGHYGIGGIFVAHSLPDGKFSVDDEVATRAFEAACPPAGTELAGILAVEHSVEILRIACARARGKSVADVKGALASEAAGAATDASPAASNLKSLESVIAVNPPLVLR
jgi:hypothetical protein